jgi:hypothetical protein
VNVPTEPSFDEAPPTRKDLSSGADARVREASFWTACVTTSLFVAAAAIAAAVMYSLGVASRTQAIESELAIQRGLAAFLSSPETATIVLAGTEEAPRARLKLATTASGHAMLFGYDLPLPPPGRAYQLWCRRGCAARRLRLCSDASGRGSWNEDVRARAGRIGVRRDSGAGRRRGNADRADDLEERLVVVDRRRRRSHKRSILLFGRPVRNEASG